LSPKDIYKSGAHDFIVTPAPEIRRALKSLATGAEPL